MRCILFALSLAAGLVALSTRAATAQANDPAVSIVSGPDEGREAPDFSLSWATKDTVGMADSPYSLWRDRGKTVVLAFYPRDFTKSDSVLWATFRDRRDDLFGPDAVVIGISVDSVEAHRRFAAKLDLPFRLLSDPGQKVAHKYGAGDRQGVDRRAVYVIGPEGTVRYRDLRFNVGDRGGYGALRNAVRKSTRSAARR